MEMRASVMVADETPPRLPLHPSHHHTGGNEMSNIPVAYQWLDTAHFRKNIPKGANPAEWNPLISVSDAELMVEAALLHWSLLYGGPEPPSPDRCPFPVLSGGCP
jgi:hypothetical protein